MPMPLWNVIKWSVFLLGSGEKESASGQATSSVDVAPRARDSDLCRDPRSTPRLGYGRL
jgi:hypothetical protein